MRSKKKADAETALPEKLNLISRLLQDLFILEAVKAGMGRDGIREILGVHTTRISKIRKHLE